MVTKRNPAMLYTITLAVIPAWFVSLQTTLN